jgi:carotenoid 1,2-hydratase
VSDDGQYALALIAFIGSVFSPYYVKSRHVGVGDPLEHCALNVALYGRSGKRWALTERDRTATRQSRETLEIGPSAVTWEGDSVVFRIDEVAVPLPFKLRGTVRVHPKALFPEAFDLDPNGRHSWQPIAPMARVEVALDSPSVRWSGAGYFDINAGDEPLEKCFQRWDWSCAQLKSGAAVLYDATCRSGEGACLGLRFNPSGAMERFAPPERVRLGRTLWQIPRTTRADDSRSSVAKTLEDGPFYVRSQINTRLLGESASALHESLSLDRFRQGWVQTLLPYRMPRVAG